MLSRVLGNHKNFVDIVTYDALACNSKSINHCIELGVDAVIRVKQNNSNTINDIKKKVNKEEMRLKQYYIVYLLLQNYFNCLS